MDKVMPKAPKVDTSAQQKALADQEARISAEESENKKKDAASKAARRARTSGRASLVTGAETGVARETLG